MTFPVFGASRTSATSHSTCTGLRSAGACVEDSAEAVATGAGLSTAGGAPTEGASAAGDALALTLIATAGEDAPSGRLGPSRTPASLGHATPAMKPRTAITPTRVHDGASTAGDGTCTMGTPFALR